MPARKLAGDGHGVGRGRAALRLVIPRPACRPPHRAASAGLEAAWRSAFQVAVVALVAITAFGLARVALSAKTAEASIAAGRIRTDLKAEGIVTDRLAISRSALMAPSRIESIAVGPMKMTKAASVRYICIPAAVAAPAVAPAAGVPVRTGSSAVRPLDILGAAADVTEREARALLVGDAGLAASN